MILKTIAAAGGNRAEAARRLGITTRALQYHITKAGLSRPSMRLKADRAANAEAPTPQVSRRRIFKSTRGRQRPQECERHD